MQGHLSNCQLEIALENIIVKGTIKCSFLADNGDEFELKIYAIPDKC